MNDDKDSLNDINNDEVDKALNNKENDKALFNTVDENDLESDSLSENTKSTGEEIYDDKEKRSDSIQKFFEENDESSYSNSFLGEEGEALGKKKGFWNLKRKIVAVVVALFVFAAIVYACSLTPVFDKDGNMIESTTIEEITDETTEFDMESTETTTDILRPTEATTSVSKVSNKKTSADKFGKFASKYGKSNTSVKPKTGTTVNNKPSASANSKPNKLVQSPAVESKPAIPMDNFINVNNNKLAVGIKMEDVKAVLGEPITVQESVSEYTTASVENSEAVTENVTNEFAWVYDDADLNIYQYNDFIIKTKVENNNEIVKNIKVITNNIKGQLNISPIGQEIYNISLKYGAPAYEDTNICIYKIDDNSYVYFELDNGKIVTWGIASK